LKKNGKDVHGYSWVKFVPIIASNPTSNILQILNSTYSIFFAILSWAKFFMNIINVHGFNFIHNKIQKARCLTCLKSHVAENMPLENQDKQKCERNA